MVSQPCEHEIIRISSKILLNNRIFENRYFDFTHSNVNNLIQIQEEKKIDTDLRKVKCGGWEAAKMNVKVNGRWQYFYDASEEKSLNAQEPINYTAGYTPPPAPKGLSLRMADGSKYSTARESFVQQHMKPKAPLNYVDKHTSAQPPFMVNRKGTEVRNRSLSNASSLNPHVVSPVIKRQRGSSMILNEFKAASCELSGRNAE